MTGLVAGELSVVLPAYNEASVIAQTVSGVRNFLVSRMSRFEIIVVDDGSTDGTGGVVSRLGDTRVRLVSHEHNRGYGEALRSGFNAARYSWILLMDADGQFDIAGLTSFIPHTASHEVIIGYRSQRADSPLRALFTWGYNIMMRALFHLQARDVGCAFKLFSKQSWRRVESLIISRDHKIFSVEWLWRIQQAGIAVRELPVRHYPRRGGRATGMRIDVVWAMVRALVRLRWSG